MKARKPYANVKKPWRQADGAFTNFQVRDADDNFVCEVYAGDDENSPTPHKTLEDNFNLILDAPEILAQRDALLVVLRNRGCESGFAEGCLKQQEYETFTPCDTCKVLDKHKYDA